MLFNKERINDVINNWKAGFCMEQCTWIDDEFSLYIIMKEIEEVQEILINKYKCVINDKDKFYHECSLYYIDHLNDMIWERLKYLGVVKITQL